MKTVIDRTFAVERALENKRFYLISTGAAPEERYMELMLDSFRKYISCFRGEGNREGGHVFGLGTNQAGDVTGTPAMELAYAMGKAM
jgi:hypothetical protein